MLKYKPAWAVHVLPKKVDLASRSHLTSELQRGFGEPDWDPYQKILDRRGVYKWATQ